jgi:hypothetical protein
VVALVVVLVVVAFEVVVDNNFGNLRNFNNRVHVRNMETTHHHRQMHSTTTQAVVAFL